MMFRQIRQSCGCRLFQTWRPRAVYSIQGSINWTAYNIGVPQVHRAGKKNCLVGQTVKEKIFLCQIKRRHDLQMENHNIILHQLWSSEVCWQIGWVRFPMTQQKNESRFILVVQAARTLEHHSQIFPNKYSISSRWEKTRVNTVQNVCCSMLCYPCTTSWYATFHFLRAGEYSSNTRDTAYKRKMTGWSSPPYQRTHHTHFNTPKSCAALLKAGHSLHVQHVEVVSLLKTTFKTCCTSCQTVAIYKYCNNANNSV